MTKTTAQTLQEAITAAILVAEDSGYVQTVKALLAAKIEADREDGMVGGEVEGGYPCRIDRARGFTFYPMETVPIDTNAVQPTGGPNK